jgi:hypothetical protein
MKLNEAKTKYLIFHRTQQQFSTRLTVNGKVLKIQKSFKLLGIWLEENVGWKKNIEELYRNAYSRLSLLTKLKYAGGTTEDLLHTYKVLIRSRLEYCGVAFHSSLTKQQEDSQEICQAVCLRIILQESYISYSSALEMCGLKILYLRRQDWCLQFS